MILPAAFYLLETLSKAMANPVAVRQHAKDKEFFFQNWVGEYLKESSKILEQAPAYKTFRNQGINIGYVSSIGRNSYPDYILAFPQEGYEVKGLAYPGRTTFDANSRLPKPQFNGREVFYIFGRYSKEAMDQGELEVPIFDVVIAHATFLNADNNYIHRNLNVKGFGSYGDILIRDRKMYVVPTPYRILRGLEYSVTLIVPEKYNLEYLSEIYPEENLNERFVEVGRIERKESPYKIRAYTVDLYLNNIQQVTEQNPSGGKPHRFIAFRATFLKKAMKNQVYLDEKALSSVQEDELDGSEVEDIYEEG